MKRFLLTLAVLMVSITATFAKILSGSCGDNITYTLDTESGVLKIEGTGEMYNFYLLGTPWASGDIASSVKELQFAGNITSIGDYAFWGLREINSVFIPNSVTSIGDRAFGGCSSLNSVIIPNSVTNIGWYAFTNCSSLKSITIPSSIKYIGEHTFEGSCLTSITIPSSVMFIGECAFANCSSLTSVTIPSSVTSISPKVFYGCYNLQSITVLNPIPPTCAGIETFVCENLRDKYDVYTYATLHVPAGSKEAYSSAHEWRYFPKIKEDMEIDGRTYYAPLKVKQGTMGYTEQSIKADEKYTIYIGSLGDSKINSITFNGRDVTDELVNGYYTTPEIKAASELSISYEVTSPNAVRSAELNNVRVKGYNGEVTISGIETESDVYVYDTTGKMVTNESKARGEIRLSVPENELYIVKVGQRTFKIAM